MSAETFILTKSQKELNTKLKNFLDSTDRFFLLTGKPGVGKTTMTKVVLDKLIKIDKKNIDSGYLPKVAGIALSHQAKNVLGEHIPNVFTFASAYGMKEQFNSDGSRYFEYNKYQEKTPIGECTVDVFVHDEISQYTQKMLDVVLNTTPIFSKIIFMGDKAQLPPIENGIKTDKDSPVFDLEFSNECRHDLTERVRQTKNNPILELSDVIREEIFGNHNIKRIINIIRLPNIEKSIGYGFIYYDDLCEHFSKQKKLDACLIAYRNKTVKYFNNKLRQHLLSNPEQILVQNDIVSMCDNYYHKSGGNHIRYVLHNSSKYKIGKVFKKMSRYNDGNQIHKIEVYQANISGNRGKHIIIPTEKGLLSYNDSLNQIGSMCKKGTLRWDKYWNLRKSYCNIDYGYATTAYKVQGSTYNTVYVDINDILLTKPISSKRKLQTIYTAITRAKNDVYFLKQKNNE